MTYVLGKINNFNILPSNRLTLPLNGLSAFEQESI